ncbi:MAG: hypothetical protein FJW39_30935 [Acidobacteria bacterium]|nr:hypothetical protein [Acidobacteriota bacterium]
MPQPLRILAAIALLAAILAWTARDRMNADGMSYIDMAVGALTHGPHRLVNGYWSPLYPALLATAFAITGAGPEARFAAAHGVNWLLVLGCLWAFRRMLRHGFPDTGLPAFSWMAMGWCLLYLITVAEVTPDMLTALCVLLAAGSACKLMRGGGPSSYAALGVLLAAGYYSKAVMFPGALLLIAILALFPLHPQHGRAGAAVALAAFALVAAPLVLLTSKHTGRLTFGETGSLNFAWYVNGVHPHSGWTGGGDSGQPEHPPRVLAAQPLVLEYAQPVPGTYPLWYAPSYWYKGVSPRISPVQLAKRLAANARWYAKLVFLEMGGLLAGLAALLWIARSNQSLRWPARSQLWMLLWPLSMLGLYALVNPENRLIGPYLALFWPAAFGLFRGGLPGLAERGILLAAILTVAPALVLRSAEEAASMARPDDFAVAARLRELGVRPGDRIAVVGRPFRAFYAHLAGAQVVAEVPEPSQLWTTGQPEILDRIRQTGVRAIVVPDKPASAPLPGCEPVRGTRDSFCIIAASR